MNTKIAVGLIVLTAVGTYGVSHQRRHHFQTITVDGASVGGGSILIDTETGVECSARYGMKWTDANKKAVWAAGLAAKKLEAEHTVHASSGSVPKTGADPLPPPQPVDWIDQSVDLMAAEDKYNQLVQKADKEKVPDPDSSYFQGFPLCKDVR
jgi:hypothetical protein